MKKGNWKPLFDGTCSNLCLLTIWTCREKTLLYMLLISINLMGERGLPWRLEKQYSFQCCFEIILPFRDRVVKDTKQNGEVFLGFVYNIFADA
jgi:hypothetical protein